MRLIQATTVAVLALQFFFAPFPEPGVTDRDRPLVARPSLLGKQVAAYVG